MNWSHRALAANMRRLWSVHSVIALRLVVVLMVIAATIWMGYESWRLLWQPRPWGAIDLWLRYQEVSLWFGGRQVYEVLPHAVYPPASMVVLWPFLGWLAFGPARVLWGASTIIVLALLIRVFMTESLAQTPLERVFIALVPLSAYSAGATIGNGQPTLHVLLCAVTSLLLLARSAGRWWDDLLVASLFILALVKPSVAVCFFWIVLFRPGRTRPALLIIAGYLALTVMAASFQESSLVELMRAWMANATKDLASTAVNYSHSNLQTWAIALGLERWWPAASLLVWSSLGIWVFRNRHIDIWLLIGVTAMVARFYTYHGWYDDFLVVLALIALFRIAKTDPQTETGIPIAGILFGITLPFTIAPGGLYLLPPPWNLAYVEVQTVIWLIVLGFLLHGVRQANSRPGAISPS